MTEIKEPRFPNRTVLTPEQKEQYVEALYNGFDPAEAAQQIGTTGTNVRRFRSPNSIHYDPEFGEKVKAALGSDDHRSAQLERVRAEFYKRALAGSDRLMERLLMMIDPEYRLHNGTQRLTVEADIRAIATRVLPDVPNDMLEAMILRLEEKAKALESGDDG